MNPDRKKKILSSAEWLHLTNEAYDAEKFGVRSLSRLLRKRQFSRDFTHVIDEQISDEVRHTRGYAQFVQKEDLPVSGFSSAVESLVESLPYVTSRLFVIQGIVEGFNLGLLQYRINIWREYPSRALEISALEDEQRHTQGSYEFFEELKCLDGIIPARHFNHLTSLVLGLFAKQTLCKKPNEFELKAKKWHDCVKFSVSEESMKTTSLAETAIRSMQINRKLFLKAYAGEAHVA